MRNWARGGGQRGAAGRQQSERDQVEPKHERYVVLPPVSARASAVATPQAFAEQVTSEEEWGHPEPVGPDVEEPARQPRRRAAPL